MPYYRFTGKELDPETGLYYYGARYYDPVLSRWISADPILGQYLPTGDKEKDKNLPGYGGIYAAANLSLYLYAHGRPIIYLDPDGMKPKYFVVHSVGTTRPLSEAYISEWGYDYTSGRAHEYIMPSGDILQINDYDSKKGWATKREKSNPSLRGQLINIELNYGNEGPTEAQYETLVDEYIATSKEFGVLTILPHLEVDRGIPSGHSDPVNFDWKKFYKMLEAAGVDLSKIPHWDPSRGGLNRKEHKSSWPPQLTGPIEKVKTPPPPKKTKK